MELIATEHQKYMQHPSANDVDLERKQHTAHSVEKLHTNTSTAYTNAVEFPQKLRTSDNP